MNELKTIRINRKLTQKDAAEKIGISLRSYISYENEEAKEGSIKYRFLVQEIKKINILDEEHGILTTEDIVSICKNIFSEYKIDYCYLFGSYAKGTAKETSDIDLVIASDISGIKFFELVELLRNGLHKKVDALDLNQLINNKDLLNEVLKDGIKIYG